MIKIAAHWIQKIEKKSVSFNLEGMEKKSLDNVENRNELREQPNFDSILHIRSCQNTENRNELKTSLATSKSPKNETQGENNNGRVQ